MEDKLDDLRARLKLLGEATALMSIDNLNQAAGIVGFISSRSTETLSESTISCPHTGAPGGTPRLEDLASEAVNPPKRDEPWYTDLMQRLEDRQHSDQDFDDVSQRVDGCQRELAIQHELPRSRNPSTEAGSEQNLDSFIILDTPVAQSDAGFLTTSGFGVLLLEPPPTFSDDSDIYVTPEESADNSEDEVTRRICESPLPEVNSPSSDILEASVSISCDRVIPQAAQLAEEPSLNVSKSPTANTLEPALPSVCISEGSPTSSTRDDPQKRELHHAESDDASQRCPVSSGILSVEIDSRCPSGIVSQNAETKKAQIPSSGQRGLISEEIQRPIYISNVGDIPISKVDDCVDGIETAKQKPDTGTPDSHSLCQEQSVHFADEPPHKPIRRIKNSTAVGHTADRPNWALAPLHPKSDSQPKGNRRRVQPAFKSIEVVDDLSSSVCSLVSESPSLLLEANDRHSIASKIHTSSTPMKPDDTTQSANAQTWDRSLAISPRVADAKRVRSEESMDPSDLGGGRKRIASQPLIIYATGPETVGHCGSIKDNFFGRSRGGANKEHQRRQFTDLSHPAAHSPRVERATQLQRLPIPSWEDEAKFHSNGVRSQRLGNAGGNGPSPIHLVAPMLLGTGPRVVNSLETVSKVPLSDDGVPTVLCPKGNSEKTRGLDTTSLSRRSDFQSHIPVHSLTRARSRGNLKGNVLETQTMSSLSSSHFEATSSEASLVRDSSGWQSVSSSALDSRQPRNQEKRPKATVGNFSRSMPLEDSPNPPRPTQHQTHMKRNLPLQEPLQFPFPDMNGPFGQRRFQEVRRVEETRRKRQSLGIPLDPTVFGPQFIAGNPLQEGASGWDGRFGLGLGELPSAGRAPVHAHRNMGRESFPPHIVASSPSRPNPTNGLSALGATPAPPMYGRQLGQAKYHQHCTGHGPRKH